MQPNIITPTPKSFVDYNAMERYVLAAHRHYDKSIKELESIDFWDSWKTMAKFAREHGFCPKFERSGGRRSLTVTPKWVENIKVHVSVLDKSHEF